MYKAGLYLLTIAIMLCLSTQALANKEDAAFFKKAAEQYMLAQFPKDNSAVKIEVKAGTIDESRDYGGRCEGFLTAQLQSRRILRNSQVKLSCSRPDNSWTLVIPVTIRRLVPSVTAQVNIPRRSVIDESMLSESYVDADVNSASAINDISALVGSRLKKDIKAGDQIKSGDFCMICRGDDVTLLAKTGALSVKTQGQAMSDGNLGDKVQVRNTKSRKIVTGTVTGAGIVQVPM